MIPDITRKIKELIIAGITTEMQVVYLLVAIRKIIEQEQLAQQYKYLNFHCNWALHSFLDRGEAQEILNVFDSIHIHYCVGNAREDLSQDLKNELRRISRMESFKKEIIQFLQEKNLPSLNAHRSDGWIHFQHLYAKVVEDCPLILKSRNASMSIQQVTVNIELADQIIGGEVNFRVIWNILDRNNHSGSHMVYNSFSLGGD